MKSVNGAGDSRRCGPAPARASEPRSAGRRRCAAAAATVTVTHDQTVRAPPYPGPGGA